MAELRSTGNTFQRLYWRKLTLESSTSAAVLDPKRTIKVTNNLNICSQQHERKMCQVDSFCYVSSVVAALSTLPDTG